MYHSFFDRWHRLLSQTNEQLDCAHMERASIQQFMKYVHDVFRNGRRMSASSELINKKQQTLAQPRSSNQSVCSQISSEPPTHRNHTNVFCRSQETHMSTRIPITQERRETWMHVHCFRLCQYCYRFICPRRHLCSPHVNPPHI